LEAEHGVVEALRAGDIADPQHEIVDADDPGHRSPLL
jgi:hypothetical protein